LVRSIRTSRTCPQVLHGTHLFDSNFLQLVEKSVIKQFSYISFRAKFSVFDADKFGGRSMNNVGNWVMGAASAIMAVGGLFVASVATSDISYYGGLGFFVFAVLLTYLFIKVSTGD